MLPITMDQLGPMRDVSLQLLTGMFFNQSREFAPDKYQYKYLRRLLILTKSP